jgi:hypothetical protein
MIHIKPAWAGGMFVGRYVHRKITAKNHKFVLGITKIWAINGAYIFSIIYSYRIFG